MGPSPLKLARSLAHQDELSTLLLQVTAISNSLGALPKFQLQKLQNRCLIPRATVEWTSIDPVIARGHQVPLAEDRPHILRQ